MKKIFLSLLFLAISGCTVLEAGKIKDERKELYDYNNNKEFCDKNPQKCVNGIPWM
ncbi:MAG: hypothetical protein J6039_04985 [Alphaproteobacteria bacterium]|nr:hypothetical protein [Alphaproteobacteria bacterium]